MKLLVRTIKCLIGICLFMSFGVAYTDIKTFITRKIYKVKYKSALGKIDTVVSADENQWISGKFSVRGQKYKFSDKSKGTAYVINDKIAVKYNQDTPEDNYIGNYEGLIRDIICELGIGICGIVVIGSCFKKNK